MATFGATLRRGLPRRPGGEPWPPAADAPVADVPVAAVSADSFEEPAVAAVPAAAPVLGGESAGSSHPLQQTPPSQGSAAPSDAAPVSAAAAPGAPALSARTLRRGLPRVPGGEPWPPAPAAAPAPAASEAPPVAGASVTPAAGEVRSSDAEAPVHGGEAPDAAVDAPLAGAAAATVDSAAAPGARQLRRGLPRVTGGEPWPPAGEAPAAHAAYGARPAPGAVAEASVALAPEERRHPREDAQGHRRESPDAAPPAAPPATAAEPVAATAAAATAVPAVATPASPGALVAPEDAVRAPLPFTPTVWPGAAARSRPAPRPAPTRIGPFTRLQWAGAVIVGGAGLLYAAALAVFAVRWLLSTGWGMDFLAAYPGEYHLPEGAPVGFPAWLGWQHFFNVFLMVLIIRSGLQVRTEKRPSAFWSPRRDAKRKISLNLWFHQSLDILWIVNGVIFVILLFVTGQWMRIVPTSWEVFPNAVSAALQYVSLDWPTENGWVNYNSLQQLAYFATVFIAAPLAIVTGVRMSGVWPKNATTLNKAYPVEWARAVHFPVMIYFVLFIFVHVVLVFATGALRNLNHMYAATDEVNWVGFWIFALSMLVIAAAWVAARPLVLAPIARLFGKVSGR